jgi:membrane protease subunit (stomatin/prohibitin family)
MRRRRGGLVRGVARTAVVAGTASAVAGRVHHRQDQRWAAEEDAQYAEAQQQYAVQQAAAAPSSDDQLVEIQKLAQLHSQGILTDEEFAAKKAQILGI